MLKPFSRLRLRLGLAVACPIGAFGCTAGICEYLGKWFHILSSRTHSLASAS